MVNYSPSNLSNEALNKHRDSYTEYDKQIQAGGAEVKANMEIYTAYVNHGILVINRELKKRALLELQKQEEKCQDDLLNKKMELNCSTEFSLEKLKRSYDEETELLSVPISNVVI